MVIQGNGWFPHCLGENSLVHKLIVMAVPKLHLNATNVEHPVLKSVNEKSQSFKLAQEVNGDNL